MELLDDGTDKTTFVIFKKMSVTADPAVIIVDLYGFDRLFQGGLNILKRRGLDQIVKALQL